MTAKKKHRVKVVKIRPHTPKPDIHEVVLQVESPDPPPVVSAAEIADNFHEYVAVPRDPVKERSGFWNWLFGNNADY